MKAEHISLCKMIANLGYESWPHLFAFDFLTLFFFKTDIKKIEIRTVTGYITTSNPITNIDRKFHIYLYCRYERRNQ